MRRWNEKQMKCLHKNARNMHNKKQAPPKFFDKFFVYFYNKNFLFHTISRACSAKSPNRKTIFKKRLFCPWADLNCIFYIKNTCEKKLLMHPEKICLILHDDKDEFQFLWRDQILLKKRVEEWRTTHQEVATQQKKMRVTSGVRQETFPKWCLLDLAQSHQHHDDLVPYLLSWWCRWCQYNEGHYWHSYSDFALAQTHLCHQIGLKLRRWWEMGGFIGSVLLQMIFMHSCILYKRTGCFEKLL